MTEKSIKNAHKKQKAASSAAGCAQGDDTVYLDADPTTLEMISFLAGKQTHVVTSSVHRAVRLSDMEVSIIMLGGTLEFSTKAIIGTTSMEQLQHFRFNKAFLGADDAHLEFGLTTLDPEEIILGVLAIHQAETAYVLLDHTKFNKVTFTEVGESKSATLLADCCLVESLQGFQQKTILTGADR